MTEANGRAVELLRIEHQVQGEVTLEDLSSAQPVVRRAAVRALARMRRAESAPLLGQALHDEDPEVVAFAAFGLGWLCRSPQVATEEVVKSLAVRGVTWEGATPSGLDPLFALARALGQCATPASETTLLGWLQDEPAYSDVAPLALGELASVVRSSSVEAERALVQTARARPPGAALYPLTQGPPHTDTRPAVCLAARTRLQEAGDDAPWAARTLRFCGAEGGSALRDFLVSKERTAPSAVAALDSLHELGAAGRGFLLDTLEHSALLSLRSLPVDLVSPVLGTRRAALAQVPAPPLPQAVRSRLFELASLPFTRDTSPAGHLRIAQLRCAAAAALVGGEYDDPLLQGCGADQTRVQEHARLTVLARRPLTGARAQQLAATLDSPSVASRVEAVEMLATHPEVPSADTILARALASSSSTLQRTAAQVLTAHPDRGAATSPPQGTPSISQVDTVLERLLASPVESDAETTGFLLEAAGARNLTSTEPAMRRACVHPHPVLRSRAAHALLLLGAKDVACDRAGGPMTVPRELDHLVHELVHVRLDTDVGALWLELDPAYAKVAVTRMADRVASGWYDGLSFHRVLPGFVVQFGEADERAAAGAELPTLHTEGSPLPFLPLDVGVALSGADTGTTQMFVTLGRSPHLDGTYAHIGRAEGPWSSVTAGDRIHKATLVHP